jgi:putative ABC transport system permease protein
VEVASVNGDYFGAMGIPLLRGRMLEAGDTTTDAVGVLVNQQMADEVWPGEDPIGKRFGFGTPPPWLTVVGVVGNARQWSAERPALNQLYFPYVSGWASNGFLVVRVDGDETALAQDVRRAVLSVDPTQPPSDIQAMSDRVTSVFSQRRFYTTLIALFAGAALLLAAAGVYGTVSYYVARRVRDIGIRMALGAAGSGILVLVIRRGFRLALLGLAIGLVGVWATTSLVEGLVYGIGSIDVLTLAGGCVALAATAILASALPGLRAIRVPAVVALRSE